MYDVQYEFRPNPAWLGLTPESRLVITNIRFKRRFQWWNPRTWKAQWRNVS